MAAGREHQRLVASALLLMSADQRVEPEKGKITFDDAAAAVVTDYKINRRRSLAYVKRRITLHLTPFFEGRRPSVIDKREVQEYIADRLDTGATNASINRDLAILKRAFTLAEIPQPAFRMLREDNTRQGFFEASSPPCSPTYPRRCVR